MMGETGDDWTVLTLDGHTETVNGLSSSGDETRVFVTNLLVNTEGTLRVGANNATSTFNGTIMDYTDVSLQVGKVKVSKVGSGTLTLTNAANAWRRHACGRWHAQHWFFDQC